MVSPASIPHSGPRVSPTFIAQRLAIFALAALLYGPPAAAADAGFRECVDALQRRARREDIAPAVVRDVLAQVEHQDRVIELDRRQPEFAQTFAAYFSQRVTAARVQRGRELLERHRALLERLQRDYGVPPHYLLAFWGLETNFGSYLGETSVPDALATLACDRRRGNYFKRELLAALRIIEAGDVAAARMKGSWAGAMGQVQFMPSVFLEHAVDGDNDGRRNLWASVPDALASAGSFLDSLGWVEGLRWGREVRVPEAFDYTLAGREQTRSLAEWAALGVTDAFERALPPLDLPASIIVPAGHEGPKFIVYENFDVIMGWNPSAYYALAVGRLADRIAGAGPLHQPPPESEIRFSRELVTRLQDALNARGFKAGETDGILGPATRAALRRFQAANGLRADGHADVEVLAAMDIAVGTAAAPGD